jgi:hypothetical protein
MHFLPNPEHLQRTFDVAQNITMSLHVSECRVYDNKVLPN